MKAFNDDGIYTYIYNGNIINSDLTFNDIGIKNEQLLIAIKKEQEKFNEMDYKWIELSCDPTFGNSLHLFSNKQTKREFNRLKDLRNIKIEGSLKLYKKFSHKLYLQKSAESENPIFNDLEINYEPSATPCTEAMPILW